MEKLSNLALLNILKNDFELCAMTEDEYLIDNLEYKDIEILRLLLNRLIIKKWG